MVEPTNYRWNKTSPPSSHIIWAPLVEHVLGWAVVTKTTRTGQLMFLTVLEAESPRSECQHGWVLMRTLFQVASFGLLIVTSYDGKQREEASSLVTLTRVPSQSWGIMTPMSYSNPNFLLRVPPSNTITWWRIEFQCVNLEESKCSVHYKASH